MLLLLIRKMRHAIGVVSKTYAVARMACRDVTARRSANIVIARQSKRQVYAKEVL